jgi:phosphate uptake regulator
MNSQEFEERTIDLEKRLERASKTYNRCMGTVI